MLTLSNRVFQTVLFTGLILSVAVANADEKFAWKLKKDTPLAYELVQEIDTDAKVMGQNIKTKIIQAINTDWTINDDQDAFNITQTIKRVRFEMQSAFASMKYDSDSKEEADNNNPLLAGISKQIGALVGKEIGMKMAADGNVSDVKLPAALNKKKGGADPLSAISAGPQNLAQSLVGGFAFPEKTPTVHDKWTKKTESDTPQASVTKENTFTYLGTKTIDGKELEEFAVTTVVDMKLRENPNAPFKLDIKVKEQESDGKIYFDAKAGRVDHTNIKHKLVMETSVNGQVFEQVVNTTTKTRLKDAKEARPEKSNSNND